MTGSERSALAEDLRRQAAAMIEAAKRKLAQARELDSAAGTPGDRPEIIDFDTLPGRSPYTRAEALVMGRRIRDRLFPERIFGEPAWDLLLELFLARRDMTSVPLDLALTLTMASQKSALRWIELLASRGLIERFPATGDRCAETVALSRDGFALMNRFFAFTEGQAPGRERQGPALRAVSSRREDSA